MASSVTFRSSYYEQDVCMCPVKCVNSSVQLAPHCLFSLLPAPVALLAAPPFDRA